VSGDGAAASGIGLAADVRSAAAALARQPVVPLVSITLVVADEALSGGKSPVRTLAGIAVFLFMLGWYGVERVFFLRQFGGRPAALSHLLSLVRFFVRRFFVLGVLVGSIFLASFFGLARILGIDVYHLGDGNGPPISFGVAVMLVVLWIDFGLTFVTPALSYTTRSVVRALDIGLGMIGETWPRSVLYVLCPPLALSFLNHVFPVGAPVVQLAITCVVTIVGLLAKGAIAAFYLRERGSYAEDGAAYRAVVAAEPAPTPAVC